MSNPLWDPAQSLAAQVQSGRRTAVSVVAQALARSREVHEQLNCFAEIADDYALSAAAGIDRARAEGRELGPLAGVPIAVKDSTPVATLGMRSGSRAYADVVATEDSVMVRRLRAAGAVVVGKTTLSEVAYSSFCDSPLTGITRNPWNPERTPGGSSGGSAVAVATGCVTLAEGTDMGGSIRIPASFTGVIGMKPSAGRIPNDDQPSVVDDIAHHGLLARSTADLARGLDAVYGADSSDPNTLGLPRVDLGGVASVAGLRVAVSPDLGFFAVEPYVLERLNAVASALAAQGATVLRADPGWDREMADAWVRHWHVHLAALFGADLERVRTEVDPRLWSIVERARTYSAVAIKADERLRTLQWQRMSAFWRRADVLLSPTMSRSAVSVSEDDAMYHRAEQDGRKHGLDLTSLFNWVPWCPAISVPAGAGPDGLPVGVHVAAQPYRDDVALAVARAVEAAFGVPAPPQFRGGLGRDHPAVTGAAKTTEDA